MEHSWIYYCLTSNTKEQRIQNFHLIIKLTVDREINFPAAFLMLLIFSSELWISLSFSSFSLVSGTFSKVLMEFKGPVHVLKMSILCIHTDWIVCLEPVPASLGGKAQTTDSWYLRRVNFTFQFLIHKANFRFQC